MPGEPDWGAIRGEFPALAHWTYLNTATYGQLPRRAVAAVASHFARRDERACADYMSWFDDIDRIREAAARMIGAAAADIAFIPNASTGLALLMNGLDWKPGDRVVTLENEFPNHIYFPAHLRKRGVEFAEVPWERFYDSITARTRLVAVSTVSYSTGFAPPLVEIGAFLRERGVRLYVDGTQSLGALRFDVQAVRPDVFSVHGYKWLLSPNGAGFVYVSPEMRPALEPQVIGWRSHKDWRNPDQLFHGTPEFSASAEKYEGGMPNFPPLYAMGESIAMFLEIGLEAIERRVMELAGKTREALRGLGAEILSDSQIVCARFAGMDASQLARQLNERRVLVAARQGNLRVSAHFYNNEEDIARLAANIDILRRRM